MAAVAAVGPNGEKATMTRKTLDALREHGWSEAASTAGRIQRNAQALVDAHIEPALVRAATVLADVDGDPEKALTAFEAESALDEPNTDLLDALEQIINHTVHTDPEV